jgi:hypothetical protein
MGGPACLEDGVHVTTEVPRAAKIEALSAIVPWGNVSCGSLFPFSLRRQEQDAISENQRWLRAAMANTG